MNYSSYPIEDQSQNSRINLLYNSKKNIKKNPISKVSKMNNNIRKSIEHFSNPKKRKNKSSTKNDSTKKEQDSNERENNHSEKKSDPQVIYMDNDDKDDDNNSKSDQITSELDKSTSELEKSTPEIETPPPKTFLSKLISGVLSIVFLALIGFIIYAGYMYFIKKKNIFSTIINSDSQNPNSETSVESLSPVDSTPQPLITESQINSSNTVEASNNIEPLNNMETEIGMNNSNLESPSDYIPDKVIPTSSQPSVDTFTPSNSIVNINTENLGQAEVSKINDQEFEMTGGDNDMVSDIINILQKFQH